MKKSVLIILLLISTILFSQEIPYSFKVDTMDFQLLSDSTSINKGGIWDENSSYPLTFDFQFKIIDQIYSNINVMAGGVQFVGYGNKILNIYHSPFGGMLLRDRGDSVSLSPISYRIDEEGGNKILKIEWRNAGFRQSGPDPPDPSHFVTFQVWLIENENKLMIHYGANNTTLETYGPGGSAQGPFVKLVIDGNALAPFGPAGNPSWNYEDCSMPCYSYVKGTPPEDMVYQFCRKVITSVNVTSNEVVEIYPNPTKGIVHLSNTTSEELGYQLYSMLGEDLLKADHVTAKNSQIDLSTFAPATYLLRIFGKKGNVIYSGKVYKK